MTDIPGDYSILAPWFNFIRAMRSRLCTAGYTVVTVKAIVDDKGNPVAWLEPESYKISPVSANGTLKAIFGEGDKTAGKRKPKLSDDDYFDP
jgi:hypothetical protein